jgi:hypothetical protein
MATKTSRSTAPTMTLTEFDGSPASAAVAFSRSPAFLGAFFAAHGDDDLRRQAVDDSKGFLDALGVLIPRGVSVTFFEGKRPPAAPAMPGPDWNEFTITLTNCRTYWRKNKDGKPEQVTICLGFVITRNPVPGGIRGAGTGARVGGRR